MIMQVEFLSIFRYNLPMEKISLKQKIRAALSEILVYLSEQKVVFISSFLAFIAMCLEIYDAKRFFDLYYGIYEEISYGCAMATVFAIPASLVSQKFSSLKKYAFQISLALLGGVLGFFAYKDGFGDEVYKQLYYYGIGFAVIAASLFLFMRGANAKTYFALVFKHFLFCALMSLVVLGGICLLVYAVQNLILQTDDYDIYECCVAFAFFIFAINSFAFHLFYRRNEESSGKAFKIITLYILLPIFAVLLAILYAYLLKALVLLTLPNGQINWFVSVASCVYIVFYFILREYEDLPAVRVFYRFGAFAFIPLICVQIPAYFIRVNAYGFTGYRYSSLLFIIFSVVTILLTFVKKGRFTKYSLLILSAVILFDSVSPFNLIKMARKNQFGRMMRILDKYEMFDHENDRLSDYDRAALENTISDEDREILLSSYKYIAWKSKIPVPEWAKDKSSDYGYDSTLYFSELFGIKENREDEKIQYFSFGRGKTASDRKTLDISEFKKMREMYAYESSHGQNENGNWGDYVNKYPKITQKTENGDYDLTAFFFSLKETAPSEDYLWFSPDEKTSFCFTSIRYEYNEERGLFKEFSYSGWVFER